MRDVDARARQQWPRHPVAEIDADPDTYSHYNLQYLRNTSIGNILNLCGLSVPCGFTSKGLPVGLMIYAKSFDEAWRCAYQQAIGICTRRTLAGWMVSSGSAAVLSTAAQWRRHPVYRGAAAPASCLPRAAAPRDPANGGRTTCR